MSNPVLEVITMMDDHLDECNNKTVGVAVIKRWRAKLVESLSDRELELLDGAKCD